jgi:hypothetical protein
MIKRGYSLDRFTRSLLCILTALLGIVAVELWVALPSTAPAAVAQIPDTGLQRLQIVEEARKTNELLREILDHLKNGTVKVRTESADKRGKVKNSG